MQQNSPVVLIGIAGTNGSGKDSAGEILAKHYGYMFISMTDMLRAELGKRGVPSTRDNMRDLSAEWRRQQGLGVLIDKCLEVYRAADKRYEGLVVASLRNPGEADRVHELGGKVVWVDADPRVRYERISGRGRIDDRKSFEEFLAEEQAEMAHSGDAATLSMADVKAKADLFLENNGNDLQAYQRDIAKLLQ
jgi:dephospho-CoA kinase